MKKFSMPRKALSRSFIRQPAVQVIDESVP
jgi:hypothetical protein